MSNPLRSGLLAAAASLLALPLVAQGSDGSYWSEYAIPANVTNVRTLGSEILLETPTAYHFWSGLHRRWVVHPVIAPTILGFTNSYCLFQDGSTIYGYSARTSAIEPLSVSANATWDIGSATSSWTAVVVDGSTVYGWSGFLGQWRPLTVSGTASVAVGSHSLSCDDGTTISCFSAFFGEWVSIPNRGAVGLDTWRNGAVVQFQAPDEVVSFSSYTNAWTTHTGFTTGQTTFYGHDAYALLEDLNGVDRLWVGALHGEFLQTATPAGTDVQRVQNCAILVTPNNDVYGYSPARSTLTAIPVTAAPTVTMALGFFSSFAVIDDGVKQQAFSGLTGSVAETAFYLPFPSVTVRDTVAFLEGPGGLGFAYSSVRGEWVAAPQAVSTSTFANFECVLRETPNGFEAFSARTGTFATLPPGGTAVTLASGAMIAVTDADSIDVFEPRYCRWEHQDTGANPVFGMHRLTGVGRDATTLYGYSLFTNGFEPKVMQGTYQSMIVNSSIAMATTSTHYYPFTANGSLSTFARFPEFTRFHALGAPISHVQAGNPGSFCVALLALDEAEITTPFGVLRVDPNPLTLSLGFVPADGLLVTPIATPNVPALRGIEIFLQDFLLKPDTSFALSNGQAHYFW